MNKKKLLIIALVAVSLGAAPYLSHHFMAKNSEAADLTAASVFDAPISQSCEYQDEIDESFLSLDPSSGNYDVLYRSLDRKYSSEQYTDCEVPEPRRELSEKEVAADSDPIVEAVAGSESQLETPDTTYYEKAYNYVPEVPTPVFEYPAP